MSKAITVYERLQVILEPYRTGTMNKDRAYNMLADIRDEFGVQVYEWEVEVSYHDITIYTEKKGAVVQFYLNEDGEVRDMRFDEETLMDVMDIMSCPSCGDGRMEHRQVENPMSLNDGMTHVYVCDLCPMIMFEYLTDEDLQALPEAIR